MKASPCPRLWEIDAHREGRLGAKANEDFRRHVRGCADCRTRIEEDEALRQLARSLPDCSPGELPLRRLKARLLRDAALGAPAPAFDRRPMAVAAILAVGLGLSAWLLVAARTPPRAMSSPLGPAMAERSAPEAIAPPEALAGTVLASPSARWSQTRGQGIERVRLDEGAIRVHVRHQSSGERFLVLVPDGEIEVRGTTFDVTVEHGGTARVHVDEGVVELRVGDRPAVRLRANETWIAPPLAPSATRNPSPPPRAAMTALPPAAPPPKDPVDEDGDYAGAVERLRKGDYDGAATAFHTLAEASSSPWADDSSFLEAVALSRAGRTDAAALVAERHLASFPGSFHRKDASILVARAASQRGDCAKARTALAPWMGASPEANVSAALGPCEP